MQYKTVATSCACIQYNIKTLVIFTFSVTTINTQKNQAYQAFTTSQPSIKKSDEISLTYEPVEESTLFHTSSVVNDPSEGYYEN